MGFLDRFRTFDRPDPPDEVTLAAIGRVRNDVGKPRPHGWEKVESRIELPPEHAERLRGLDEYSHVVVVFYMDLAADAPEKPETLPVEGVDTGILATRSQLRPNHIGVAAVPLLGLEGAVLRVRGLDAIDGTPVIDIKPYMTAFAPRGETVEPGWVGDVMSSYWKKPS
jgi:tRNA-Thr(GGU) m(6)t(6)A37 methyltransferase TsaA